MAQIMLVGFEQTFQQSLLEELRRHGHVGRELEPAMSFARVLESEGRDIDVVVVDATSEKACIVEYMATLQSFRNVNGLRPMILCITRVSRGAQFELGLERKGARVYGY